MKLTQTRLKALFLYDPGTGVFTRLKPTHKRGVNVGGPNPKGYHRIGIDGERYLTHRLVWLWVHGEWPIGEIDHINRDNSDNRLANLRDVSPSENQHNHGLAKSNTSGFAGVSWDAFNCRWTAAITSKRAHFFLGRFDTAAEASVAYQTAKRIHHPTAPI